MVPVPTWVQGHLVISFPVSAGERAIADHAGPDFVIIFVGVLVLAIVDSSSMVDEKRNDKPDTNE